MGLRGGLPQVGVARLAAGVALVTRRAREHFRQSDRLAWFSMSLRFAAGGGPCSSQLEVLVPGTRFCSGRIDSTSPTFDIVGPRRVDQDVSTLVVPQQTIALEVEENAAR